MFSVIGSAYILCLASWILISLYSLIYSVIGQVKYFQFKKQKIYHVFIIRIVFLKYFHFLYFIYFLYFQLNILLVMNFINTVKS